MKMYLFLACVLSSPLAAETVVATRMIRAQEVITDEAVRLDPQNTDGAFTSLRAVLGQEARVAVYPGRPVMQGQVGPPALVDRNQLVELIFSRGGLRIVAEGRALARGGAGDRIRVMNVSSRNILFGTVAMDGTVLVAP